MTRTTAPEFKHKLGALQRHAEKEPVEFKRRGRRALVLMSVDHYDWLMAAARRTHKTEEAADVMAQAVRQAEMAPDQA
jgi:prevent-host-death family protein